MTTGRINQVDPYDTNLLIVYFILIVGFKSIHARSTFCPLRTVFGPVQQKVANQSLPTRPAKMDSKCPVHLLLLSEAIVFHQQATTSAINHH